METQALATQQTITPEQIELIKKTVAVGATDSELQLFLYQAKRRGLDPLLRQIHFIKRKRWNPETKQYDEVGTIQTGIDGLRVAADRTRKLAGIKRGVIVENGKLTGGWSEVSRSDWKEPARNECYLDEYLQKNKDGEPMGLWKTMPKTMIMKCAEAGALRMAFPEDLSGIYTDDEMGQADSEVKVIKSIEKSAELPPAEKAPDINALRKDWKRLLKDTKWDRPKINLWYHALYGIDPTDTNFADLTIEQLKAGIKSLSPVIPEGQQAKLE